MGGGPFLDGPGRREVALKAHFLRPRHFRRRSHCLLAASGLCGQYDVWATIPPRRNRTEPICISRHLYRSRNLAERFFNKIKQCWRVVTRYDKLAANYLAFTQLVSTRLWLRVDKSAPERATMSEGLEPVS